MRYSRLGAAHRVSFLVSSAAAVVLIAACGEEPTSSSPSASSPAPLPALASAGLGSWTVKAPAPTRRGGMAGAVARNASGKYLFYTIGGGNSDNLAMRRVEAYDLTTNSWSRAANLPVDRVGAVATTLGGKIYVVGGFNLNSVRTKTLFVYDPIANTWTQKTSMPIAGWFLIPAALGGKLYVFTRFGEFTDAPRLYRYNPTTNLWTRRADPPDHWNGIGGVIDGKFYLAWGASDAVDVYDPNTNSWTTTLDPDCEQGELGVDCSMHSPASTVFQNQLYSIHGQNDDEYAATWAYNPLINAWGRKANMNQPRAGRAVAGTVKNAAGQQRIVVVGGHDLDGERIFTTEVYTP